MNRKTAAEKIKLLRKALADTEAAFHVTLMVCAEKNGETDADKRYAYGERHPQIKAARAALRDTA